MEAKNPNPQPKAAPEEAEGSPESLANAVPVETEAAPEPLAEADPDKIELFAHLQSGTRLTQLKGPSVSWAASQSFSLFSKATFPEKSQVLVLGHSFDTVFPSIGALSIFPHLYTQ